MQDSLEPRRVGVTDHHAPRHLIFRGIKHVEIGSGKIGGVVREWLAMLLSWHRIAARKTAGAFGPDHRGHGDDKCGNTVHTSQPCTASLLIRASQPARQPTRRAAVAQP